jgi:hypothetical protein
MEFSASQTHIGFAIVALGVAASYLGAVWLIMTVGRLLLRFRKTSPTSNRPGEMVHQALRISGRRWDHYRTAALLFGVSFLLLVNFGRDAGWGEQPTWLSISALLCVIGVLGIAALKMVQLGRYRARLNKSLELHTQVAQRLVEVQLRGNRAYPSVRAGDDVIDYVVVGHNGVYALQLTALPENTESVQFDRGGLVCQPGEQRISLQQFNKSLFHLSSKLGEQIGSRVSVLPVIVLPTGRIVTASQSGDNKRDNSGDKNSPMLVSLQACASFVGWQKDDFFLHDDDITRLSGWLGKQALENPPPTLAAAISSLDRQIRWPALIRP